MIYLNISESEYQDAACSDVAIIHHTSSIMHISESVYQDAACSEVAVYLIWCMIYLNISESEYQDAACSEVAIIHHTSSIIHIFESELSRCSM